MEKAFEELQIKDDFVFSVIMRNPRFCKTFLERILGIKISRIEYPRSQETIDISADAKSVRLDIYVEDGKDRFSNENERRWRFAIGKSCNVFRTHSGTGA